MPHQKIKYSTYEVNVAICTGLVEVLEKENHIGMISNLRQVPNRLTAVRFLAIPVMWVCALRGHLTCIGIGLMIGFVTDLLDGAIARKFNQTSKFGSKFDSITDQILQISALFWILLLMPEIISENYFISLFALTIYITSLLVGIVKFKRIANLHLYLLKSRRVIPIYLFDPCIYGW